MRRYVNELKELDAGNIPDRARAQTPEVDTQRAAGRAGGAGGAKGGDGSGGGGGGWQPLTGVGIGGYGGPRGTSWWGEGRGGAGGGGGRGGGGKYNPKTLNPRP
jgi:hypothetical protein